MKVLVANRGEIAIRIMRTCREMGFPTVAVYSDADRTAPHARFADEAILIGEPKSYLDSATILAAARRSGAQAVHPGYGFLSENAAFARAVEEAGMIFIGPRPETIEKAGDKLEARRIAREAGLPVLPGSDESVPCDLPVGFAETVQYPVLVKAAAGGGGRGIRLARSAEELEMMISAARLEACQAFDDDTVYLEPLVPEARHLEVQILGDGKGNVITLGERECSIQRRRQKLIEESPAPGLSPGTRQELLDAALRLGCALNYRSLGTIEFLLDSSGKVHFIEINPRIQVEHPVTEMVTGFDLVREQLNLAAGGQLRLRQEDVIARGAAIEARVLAEDVENDFLPASGAIVYVKEPGGPFVRVDSALYIGMPIGTSYDSLLAKVIVWGVDRPAAIARATRALREFQIGGVPTDLNFLIKLLESPAFVSGEFNTTYLDSFKPVLDPGPDLEMEAAVAIALFANNQREQAQTQPNGNGHGQPWRDAAWREQMRGMS